MKKTLILLALTTLALAKPVDVIVSIVPQAFITKAIGKDLVNVTLLIKPGTPPTAYEPKASQMRSVSKAKIYFTIGAFFEDRWLDKIKNQNKNLLIVATDKGIDRLKMAAHKHDHGEEHHEHDEHEEHEHHEHHDHDHDKKHHEHEDHDDKHHEHGKGLDPHIWCSPYNAKIIAKNTLDALVKMDPKNKKIYEKNYNAFVKKADKTDKTIKKLLAPYKGKSFAVYHPAWGYFAKRYDLHQISIEVQGKAPKPSQTVEIIKFLKDHKIKLLLTQKEFSKKSAKLIAKEIGAKVESVSPLAKNYFQNLVNLAKLIKSSYE